MAYWNRIALALVLVPLLAFYPAWGQKERPENSTVLVFNAQRLFEMSKVGRDIAKQTDGMQKNLTEEVDNIRKELESESKKLEEQRTLLPEEVFFRRLRSLRDRQQEEEESITQRVSEIQAGQRKARLDVLTYVYDVVEELVDEHEAHVVLERSVTYYYDAGLDVTEEIVRRLNQRITAIKVTPMKPQDDS